MQSTLRARRLELELMLESHLPESRYSPALLSLMHEEDALLRGGVNCDDTGRAIDARLGKETSVFYTQVARQRAFKWGALLSKAHEPLPSAARTRYRCMCWSMLNSSARVARCADSASTCRVVDD